MTGARQGANRLDRFLLRLHRIEPLQHLAPFAEAALGEQLVDERAPH
jgi:hypothetical protein